MPSRQSTPALHAELADYHLPTKLISVTELQDASPRDSVGQTLAWAKSLDIDVVPIRQDQEPIHSYVFRDEIQHLDHTMPIVDAPTHTVSVHDLVAAEGTIDDTFMALASREWLFTFERRTINGIVTRGDLQHPIARMELFGLLTRLEVLAGHAIATAWPDDAWVEVKQVPRDVVTSARGWWKTRQKRNEEPLALVDCVSLAGKLRILECASDQRENFELLVEQAGLSSTEHSAFPDELKILRDNLAHAHDLTDGIAGRWKTVLAVVALVQGLIRHFAGRPS